MLTTFRSHYQTFFERADTIAFLGLLMMMILSGLMEVAGVASVLPFFGVLMDPSSIEENERFHLIYQMTGASDHTSFSIILGCLIIGLMVTSTVINLLSLRYLNRILWRTHDRLSQKVLKANLALPFEQLIDKDPSTYSRNVLNDVEAIVVHYFYSYGMIASRFVISVVIVALIGYTDLQMAGFVALVFGGLYVGIFLACTRRLKDLGHVREWTVKSRFLFAAEIFNGAKEIKVQNPDLHIIGQYINSTNKYSKMMEDSMFLQSAPKFVIETVGLSSTILIVLLLIMRGDPFSTIMPSLILFAVGGYRLLPSLQVIYSSIAMAKVFHPLFLRVSFALQDAADSVAAREQEKDVMPRRLTKAIEFRQVSYCYPRGDRNSVEGFTAHIPSGQTTALIGASGAGKSTLVDLLLGLLPLGQGQICIDGSPLEPAELAGWRRNIGYVPQQALTLNASIRANIAFTDDHLIDDEKVTHAAKLAHLDSFITSLPDGYDAKIGEDGLRLSGGQRQRLVIARALYRDPDILIMDEPTSALDQETQDAFVETITELRKNKTIILISHSAKVSRIADHCILMESGRLVAEGTPAELCDRNALGQRLLAL